MSHIVLKYIFKQNIDIDMGIERSSAELSHDAKIFGEDSSSKYLAWLKFTLSFSAVRIFVQKSAVWTTHFAIGIYFQTQSLKQERSNTIPLWKWSCDSTAMHHCFLYPSIFFWIRKNRNIHSMAISVEEIIPFLTGCIKLNICSSLIPSTDIV